MVSREVTNEEKYILAIKEGVKDSGKRFQSLKSLVKLYSEQQHGKAKLRSLYNQHDARILSIYLEKISKYPSFSDPYDCLTYFFQSPTLINHQKFRDYLR